MSSKKHPELKDFDDKDIKYYSGHDVEVHEDIVTGRFSYLAKVEYARMPF